METIHQLQKRNDIYNQTILSVQGKTTVKNLQEGEPKISAQT